MSAARCRRCIYHLYIFACSLMLAARPRPRRDVIITLLKSGHALRPRFAAPDADLWSLGFRVI